MTTTEQPGQFAEHPAEGAHERDRAPVAVLESEVGITPRAANPAMIGVPLFVVGSLPWPSNRWVSSQPPRWGHPSLSSS